MTSSSPQPRSLRVKVGVSLNAPRGRDQRSPERAGLQNQRTPVCAPPAACQPCGRETRPSALWASQAKRAAVEWWPRHRAARGPRGAVAPPAPGPSLPPELGAPSAPSLRGPSQAPAGSRVREPPLSAALPPQRGRRLGSPGLQWSSAPRNVTFFKKLLGSLPSPGPCRFLSGWFQGKAAQVFYLQGL